ncbi:unnamed protein product [Lactuca saligna]|uniref:DDE Tnp4 domain-containing protein n=1 Tax=Lactuca saligna TaxID=75948 RepID=A0AA36DVR9_LACSI|nr:unnamed protein product [Lactuca saligna]
MRKEFKYYDRLTRLEMGISIDPVKNTISASKEWWDDKLKEDKEFVKFKDKNLDVYQTYYEALFRDIVAIGDKAKDCIGVIDGTHVKASVPQHEQIKFIGRKNCVAQNIMATCDFNMCFTFAWAGWEGTAHDTRIFNEVRRRCEVKFPLPTDGKYYLVDVGYPNTKGYIASYKVWMARRVLLRDMHVNFDFETQVKIVLASMAIHNYIRLSGSGDATFQIAQEESYISHNDEGSNNGIEPHDEVSSTQRRTEDMYIVQYAI